MHANNNSSSCAFSTSPNSSRYLSASLAKCRCNTFSLDVCRSKAISGISSAQAILNVSVILSTSHLPCASLNRDGRYQQIWHRVSLPVACRQFDIQSALAAGNINSGKFLCGASIIVGRRFFCPSGLIPYQIPRRTLRDHRIGHLNFLGTQRFCYF